MRSGDGGEDADDGPAKSTTTTTSADGGSDHAFRQALLGRVLGGQYRIEEHLGAGGFGDVFRAVQEKTQQSVALKVLRPRQQQGAPSIERQRARFRREMHACAQLHHPHIVRLIDSGETDDGLLFSVFDFVPGKTLADLLAEKGALPVALAVELMSQVLDALAAAHQRGIIHRDLKPNNIMANVSGLRPQITVLDFGISAFLEDTPSDEFRNLTMTREILGTPAYAAPEQLRGEPTSVKSDLYAWGLVLAECILGRPVFEGPTAIEAAHRQLSSDPVVLPARLQRHRLGNLLRWTLEKDATRRAGDATLVMERLLECRNLSDLVDGNGFFVESETALDSLVTSSDAGEATGPAMMPGERRQVTALCCLTTVTPGRANVIQEDLDQTLGETQEVCARIARHFGGEVAGGFGGQVLVYFGVVRPNDSDARRAAVAALEIARALRRRSDSGPVQFQFRLGIHSGLVTMLVNDRRSTSTTFGVTPGRAMQLTLAAPVGGIVVSAETIPYLTPGFEVKGEALPAGETVNLLVGESRIDSAGVGAPRASFIGRAREIEILLQARQSVRPGHGRTVAIIGEPGIGKSRLLRELRLLDERGWSWIAARCLPELQHSALGPIGDLLVDQLAVPVKSSDSARRLREQLDDLGVAHADGAALLEAWLGLGPHPALPLSPQRQKAMLLEIVVDVTLALAARKATPVILEDLHWADPTTKEYVDLLVRKAAERGTFVVVTMRYESDAPWPPAHGAPWPLKLVEVIRLAHLERGEAERIVRELAGRDYLSPGLLANVVDRAAGNPLFVEEVTRFILESSTQVTLGGSEVTGARSSVPASLTDILTARLDRLGRARETARVAAAIGREFDYRLLAEVMREDEAVLLADLEKMVSADLLIRQRHVDRPIYTFRHALIRDAAEASLTAADSRGVHQRIAAALESLFPDLATGRPELIAYHYTSAGLPALAVDYWRKAGQTATANFAHAEAIAHFGAAIQQQMQLPPSRERSRKEIDLRVEIGLALMTIKGYSAQEVEETYRRAAELCEELGDALSLRVVYGIWVVNLVRADPEPVARLLEQFRRIEETATDPPTLLLVRACQQAGTFWFPDYAASVGHGERAQTCFDVRDAKALHDRLLRDYGFEGFFYPQLYCGFAQVITGHLGLARATWRQVYQMVQSVGDPYALAVVRLFGVVIELLCGRLDSARELSRELSEATVENTFLLWKAFGQVPRGRMMVADGNVEGGLQEIQEGLATLRAIGAMISFPLYLVLFAETLLDIGRYDQAGAVCAETLEMIESKRSRGWEPEVWRVKGQLLARTGDLPGAEAALRRSLEISRVQGALTFELASAVVLSRLLRTQGRVGEAREQLGSVLKRFDPDDDQPILQDARRLLEELAG